MNIVVTSKEEILNTGRKLIQEQGWSAVSIRGVAAACGVSVGSIYNYFDSKAELVGATVESIWHEIFHSDEDGSVFRDTQACIIWIYERMEVGCKKYPVFFSLHSIGFMREEKPDGKQRMQKTWQHILEELNTVLEKDVKVREDAFNGSFTSEKFAEVLFSLMISAFLRQDYDPNIVLEIVRRVIY